MASYDIKRNFQWCDGVDCMNVTDSVSVLDPK